MNLIFFIILGLSIDVSAQESCPDCAIPPGPGTGVIQRTCADLKSVFDQSTGALDLEMVTYSLSQEAVCKVGITLERGSIVPSLVFQDIQNLDNYDDEDLPPKVSFKNILGLELFQNDLKTNWTAGFSITFSRYAYVYRRRQQSFDIDAAMNYFNYECKLNSNEDLICAIRSNGIDPILGYQLYKIN